MQKRHSKAFRDNYLAAITTVALLLISFLSQAQIFTHPNNYGVDQPRGGYDSTLYFPTGCGVPTDTLWLFSQGFGGKGERLRHFAIYGDSCGHLVYLWDPSAKTWAVIGSGSGADSAIAGINGIIIGISGTTRYIKSDTFYNATRSRLLKTIDSMVAVNNARYVKPADTANLSYRDDTLSIAVNRTFGLHLDSLGASGDAPIQIGNDSTIHVSLQKDSLDYHHHINLATGGWTNYVQAHDSTSGNALYTKYRSDTSRANIYAAIAAGGGGGGSASGSTSNSDTITLSSHGFSVGQVLSRSASAWVLADTISHFANGVVSSVIDANNFVVTTSGSFAWTSGLTIGAVQFSSTTAGGMTTTSPMISIPLGMQVATGLFFVRVQRVVDFSGAASSFDSATSQAGGFHTQPYNDLRYIGIGSPIQFVGDYLKDTFQRSSLGSNYTSGLPSATLTFPSSTHLHVTGGDGSMSNYSEFTNGTMGFSPDRYDVTLKIVPQSNNSGDAIMYANVSTVTASPIHYFVKVDVGTANSAGITVFDNTASNVIASATGLFFNTGDTIVLIIHRTGPIFEYKLLNRKTGYQATCSYTYLTNVLSAIYEPNLGYPTLYWVQGTQDITLFQITDLTRLGGNAIVLGTSIDEGYAVSDPAKKWVNLLFQGNTNLYDITAGVTEQASDALSGRVAGIVKAHPAYGIIDLSVNDAHHSVSASALAVEIDTIGQRMVRAGTIPIIINAVPQTTVDMTPYNAALSSLATTRTWAYINIFTPLTGGSGTVMAAQYDEGDGIHPNDLGHSLMAQIVATAAPYLLTFGQNKAKLNAIPVINSGALPNILATDNYGNLFRMPASFINSGVLPQPGANFNIGGRGIFSTTGLNRNVALFANSANNDFAGLMAYPSGTTDAGTYFFVTPKGGGFGGGVIMTEFGVMNTDYQASSTNYEGLLFQAFGTSGYNINSQKGGSGSTRALHMQMGGNDVQIYNTDRTISYHSAGAGESINFASNSMSADTAQGLLSAETGTSSPMLFAISGKGTGGARFGLFKTDYKADAVNYSALTTFSNTSSFDIAAVKGGTGTLYPLHLYSGTNTGQWSLNTDGSINTTALAAGTPGSTDSAVYRDAAGKLHIALFPAGGGSSPPFDANIAILMDHSDNTKTLKFGLSSITTGTARTLTVPNTDLIVAGSNIAQTWTGAQDMTGATVTVATQTAGDNSTKAASTAYVNAASTGGTYTATLTNSINITSSSSILATYTRSNHIVHVIITGVVTPTTASSSMLAVSVPIAIGGSVSNGTLIGQGLLQITAYVSTQVNLVALSGVVDCYFTATSTSAQNILLSFDYPDN